MIKNILVCTVGGSPEPVVKAIESVKPDHVLFFCTDKDAASGKPGSDILITGQNNTNSGSTTLPNIPSQAQLSDDAFGVCRVPADDFDKACRAMIDEISRLSDEYPDASITADYTGGTKTMSAALVCSVLENADVKLQLITASRSTLDGISGSSGNPVGASISRLLIQREIESSLSAWKRFSYCEAMEGLEKIFVTADSPERAHLDIARDLSCAFSKWNAFDHKSALKKMQAYEAGINKTWPWMLRDIKLLATEKSDEQKREPLCLYDLWNNAQRCALQGRFDDAIARTYRLIEWTAQWQLRTKCDIDTANVHHDDLPPSISPNPDSQGKIRIGLRQAWELVFFKLDNSGPTKALECHMSKLQSLIKIRNHSILAHGFAPIEETHWNEMQSWIENNFLPVLDELAQKVGIRHPPKQLPKELPSSILEIS